MDEETLLLAVLNSAPRTRGRIADELDGPVGGELALRMGGTGTAAERSHVRGIRDAIQRIIRGDARDVQSLENLLDSVVLTPRITADGIDWAPLADPDLLLGARVAMAWSEVSAKRPGRLRPCANTECNLFLIDRSRPGTAKWCSMSTCGNRIKARTHAGRMRSA